MSSDLSVVCRSCQRKVKMDQIKFDDINEAYVCDSCYSVSHKVNKIKNPFVDDTITSVSNLKNNLIKYTCKKCKYHFTRQKNKSINVCPYCGSNNLDILSKDVNKIISDSNNLF